MKITDRLMRYTFFGLVCSVIMFAPECFAQDGASLRSDQRENLRGRVTQLDGKPWANAEVVLIGYALFNAPVGVADRVRAKSDARGRFRARLLPSRRYTAWAFEERSAEAGATELRESAVVTRVFAGNSLRLQEVERRSRPRTLRLSGLEAWKHHAPLRFRLRATAPMNCDLEIEGPDAESRIVLPPWPAKALRLVTSTGRVLAEQYVDRLENGAELVFRSPVRVRIDAKYRDGEEPVVRGRVLQTVDMEWVEIGRTNDKGQVTVEPFVSSRSSWQFVVVPEQGSLTLSRQINVTQARAGVDPGQAPAIVQAPISVEKTGKNLIGRVFLEKGVPAANLELVYFVSCPTGSGSWHHRKEAFRTRCDAEGNFEIRGAPDNCEWRLYAIPDQSTEVVILAAGRKPESKPLESIVIADLPRVEIAVLESDGSPAAFAKIVLSGRSGLQGIGLHSDHSFDVNRRGVMVLRIPENDLLRLAAGRDGAYVQIEPKITRDSKRIEFRLGKRAAIGGRVVDTFGRPVRGARVYYSVRRMTGARDLLSKYTGDWDTHTDENGMYSLPCPIDCVLRMHCSKTEKGKVVWARNGTPEVAVETGVVEVEDIVIDAVGQGAVRKGQRK